MVSEPQPIGESVGPIMRRVQRMAERAQENGWIASDEEPDDHQANDLAAWRDRQWARVVPPIFREARTDDLIPKLRDEIEGWVTAPGPHSNLVIFGPTGVGKSFAAVAALRWAHESSLSIGFSSVPRLLHDLRPGGRDTETTMESALLVDRFVLDDLGAERDSDWTYEQLWLIADERATHQNPLIVTVNMDRDVFVERYGQRIASRLLGGATILALGGKDRRRG